MGEASGALTTDTPLALTQGPGIPVDAARGPAWPLQSQRMLLSSVIHPAKRLLCTGLGCTDQNW